MSLCGQRKLLSERQDASVTARLLIQDALTRVHGRNADMTRHEHFQTVPSEQHVVPSIFVFGNFIDEDRQSHTRLLPSRAGHGRTPTSNDKFLMYVSRTNVRATDPIWFNASAILSDATGEGPAGRDLSPIFLPEMRSAHTSRSMTRYASATSREIICVKSVVDKSRGTSRERGLPNSNSCAVVSSQAAIRGEVA